jgi:hypothetical protein
MTRELRHLMRDLRRQGFEISPTGGGHRRITRPGQRGAVYTSSTPSDWPALKNLRAQIRKTFTAIDSPAG